MRIVFMGNPDFAVPSLERIASKYNLVGVVTGADKFGGRGRKQLIESAIKIEAKKYGIPILQPLKFRDPGFLDDLRSLKADLQIVVAFKMLPDIVWSMPPQGTVNLHSSLLPKYRGAAPIHWAIINGEVKTGLTTFKLQHKIDTGDILLQSEIPIGPDDTTGDLYQVMKEHGAALLDKTIAGIINGSIESKKQNPDLVTAAPKIYYEDAKVDPGQSLIRVHNFIRGMSPIPSAWYDFDDKSMKILNGIPLTCKIDMKPGLWVTNYKDFLGLSCADGIYKCKLVQLEGKKVMQVDELLNGIQRSPLHIKCDDVFGKLN
jgi:methionyl-tRNA formyltransferase